MRNAQLADLLRPKTFEDIVGQEHLFGERGVIRRMVESGRITNMIFYGPPGIGKTTAAEIIAAQSGMLFRRLNATSASLADVKAVLAETDNVFGAGGVLLYLDEIQYFNRKQQQSLLEYMEDGRVTLISSTTENPHFYVYNAILSRASLFEFKPVSPKAILPALRRALDYLNGESGTAKTASDELLEKIGRATGGDVRRAIHSIQYTAEQILVFHFRRTCGIFHFETVFAAQTKGKTQHQTKTCRDCGPFYHRIPFLLPQLCYWINQLFGNLTDSIMNQMFIHRYPSSFKYSPKAMRVRCNMTFALLSLKPQ